MGSGASLGSQSSVVLTQNNQWLFAVNAGSNQISAFAVNADGLELVDVVDSGGVRPISLTTYKDWLYVLNAGDSGNISGFSIGQDGSLSPLAGSTQPVSNGGVGAAPGLAQVAFSSDGSTLVVTEKTTNLLDTYAVVDGLAEAPVTHPSSGAVPFGFAFDRHGHAIVSEASGAVSSYQIDGSGFSVISPSVVNDPGRRVLDRDLQERQVCVYDERGQRINFQLSPWRGWIVDPAQCHGWPHRCGQQPG